MSNELQMLNDEMNTFLTAFESGNEEALMEMSGQADPNNKPKIGLPRLNINYDTETDDGTLLRRGAWRIWNGSAPVYADKVLVRPLLRTFEWSVWNQEEGKFSCKSVQKRKLAGDFPDTLGGNKCGRLSRQEEEALSQDDPRVLLSRSVSCNQVIYGIIDAPDALYADGTAAPVEQMPFMAYFKRSGYRPVNDFIQKQLTDRKILMHKALVEFTHREAEERRCCLLDTEACLCKGSFRYRRLRQAFDEGLCRHRERTQRICVRRIQVCTESYGFIRRH
jgi:hypothetical protein